MITVVGLGPSGLARIPGPVRDSLLDPKASLISRTIEHPAAAELAGLRPVIFCDDLYRGSATCAEVYRGIVERVIAASENGDVIYAVPGSPRVGEFAVRLLEASPHEVTVVAGESFVDAVLSAVGYDPLDRGLQILNGHDLGDPLVLNKPTIIGHLDRAEALADVLARLGRVLAEEETLTVLVDAGGDAQQVATVSIDEVDPSLAGLRTSIFVDATPGGLIGAVQTMRILREKCPWDREQTHSSLVKDLVEETYELIDAIAKADRSKGDLVAVAAVEDELGDVLLQVLFHAAIAQEHNLFGIDDVAETLRQKLVRRHPHVFGDAAAGDVEQSWDAIKARERGPQSDSSALAGVLPGLPAMQRAGKLSNRAAKAGLDWEGPADALPKIKEKLDDLTEAVNESGDSPAEVGDLLFAVVNIARHLGIDPETALNNATARFEKRFRVMEGAGSLDGLDAKEIKRRWQEAKPLT